MFIDRNQKGSELSIQNCLKNIFDGYRESAPFQQLICLSQTRLRLALTGKLLRPVRSESGREE
jgi:hypothetical protein